MRVLILITLVACLQLQAADSVTNSVILRWIVSGTVTAVYPKSIIVAIPRVDPMTARNKVLDRQIRQVNKDGIFSVHAIQESQDFQVSARGTKTAFVQCVFVNVPAIYEDIAVGNMFFALVKQVTINGVVCYDCAK